MTCHDIKEGESVDLEPLRMPGRKGRVLSDASASSASKAHAV